MIDIEKMNRKETIRALRACSTMGPCGDCPLFEFPSPGFSTRGCILCLMRHAADVLEASVSVQYE